MHEKTAVERLNLKFVKFRKKLNKKAADYRDILGFMTGDYFDFNLKHDELARQMAYLIPEICENFTPNEDEKHILKSLVEREHEIFKVVNFEEEVRNYQHYYFL